MSSSSPKKPIVPEPIFEDDIMESTQRSERWHSGGGTHEILSKDWEMKEGQVQFEKLNLTLV